MSGESEVKERVVPVTPVSGMFSVMENSVDVTSEVIVSRLMSKDDNLGMISNIPESGGLVLLKVLEHDADLHECDILVDLYEAVHDEYLEKQCSVDGWRSNQIRDMIMADLQRVAEENASVKDRMFGGARGR